MKLTDFENIPSPCYILEEDLLRRNLRVIADVSNRAGVEIIMAFKGFSMWSTFPIVKEYIKGATASSLNELRLCNEEMEAKSHTYMVAYKKNEFDEIVANSSYLTFNSMGQFSLFKEKLDAYKKTVSFGLRINPEYSEVKTELYNPSSSSSRLGVTIDQMPESLPEEIEGLHFHVLCESDSFTLENTLRIFERKFSKYLKQAKWVNLGGGHLMTKNNYDIEHLIQVLKDFKEKYEVSLILEPGSAFAWGTGTLLTTVLDIVENGGVKTAIIDASFTCHMPDCLEMPYKPEVRGASGIAKNGKKSNDVYRIGGLSCLAGDFMEEYQFDKPLQIGDQVIFEDMMHYTMVKTSTFNGIAHPSIGIWHNKEGFRLVKEFTYEDFKGRLS